MTDEHNPEAVAELLPCPFCGGAAKMHRQRDSFGTLNLSIANISCDRGCVHQSGYRETDVSIAAWNRRIPALVIATGRDTDAAVEALRKERDLAAAQNDRLWAANHNLVAEQDALTAELAASEAARIKAEAGEDKWMTRCMDEVGQHLATKADRDTLAARLTAEKAALVEALIWCSGSDDFQVDGKARGGWLKLCAPILKEIDNG